MHASKQLRCLLRKRQNTLHMILILCSSSFQASTPIRDPQHLPSPACPRPSTAPTVPDALLHQTDPDKEQVYSWRSVEIREQSFQIGQGKHGFFFPREIERSSCLSFYFSSLASYYSVLTRLFCVTVSIPNASSSGRTTRCEEGQLVMYG